MKNNDEILNQIRKVAEKSLPSSAHVYLYGSRARGDAKNDSDWDLLVILDKERVEKADYDNITYPFTELGWSVGEMIIPVMYTKKEWEESSFTPFYKNVEHDKIIVA